MRAIASSLDALKILQTESVRLHTVSFKLPCLQKDHDIVYINALSPKLMCNSFKQRKNTQESIQHASAIMISRLATAEFSVSHGESKTYASISTKKVAQHCLDLDCFDALLQYWRSYRDSLSKPNCFFYPSAITHSHTTSACGPCG